MDLPSKQVFDALLAKGVTELHHANSVLTACQFLRNRALLSRGTVERRNLFQTPQSSDSDDKRFNVWFDVFTDSVDIHSRAGNANVYGPVLFVLDVKELRKSWTGRLWMTKLNPMKWDKVSDDNRWFRSVQEIADDFNYGTFDQMIVFRHCGGELHFRDALSKIILDDPHTSIKLTEIDLYSMAFGALQLASSQGGLDVRITKRCCDKDCRCLKTYGRDARRTMDLFAPRLRKSP
ncbi:MAG TPA: hypothetical protein VGR14_04075 [Verrucomicrobiae bacterium]|jgi:hypothetical protein|nr:hypothetical protein [Verrucomicrobiae bacterium]